MSILTTLSGDSPQEGFTNRHTWQASVQLNNIPEAYQTMQNIFYTTRKQEDIENKLAQLLQELINEGKTTEYINIWLVDFAEVVRENGGDMDEVDEEQ